MQVLYNRQPTDSFYKDFEIDVVTDYIEIGGTRYPREKFFLANPRLMIWIAANVVLEYLYVHTEATTLRRELERTYSRLFRRPANRNE